MAQAIYEAVYEGSLRSDVDVSSYPFPFAWNVASDLLCAIKADQIAKADGKMAAFVVTQANMEWLTSSGLHS
jgi:hypothetical protein